MMTLQEFEEEGGCIGCQYYVEVDVDRRKGCSFHWYDENSDDWDYSKNCDEIAE